ncbi:MAG: hypothetical protein IKG47_00550 [Oscillospiraceae bacterium]|nr:hypothetical protein [Clostridiales bacterium]MBR3353835.1 hypothetical protein [Oscillospiraceae bacterium]
MDKKAKFFWTDVVKDLNKIFGVDHCKLVHPKNLWLVNVSGGLTYVVRADFETLEKAVQDGKIIEYRMLEACKV